MFEDEVVYLINKGADINIRDNSGKKAVDHFRGEIPAGLKNIFE